MLFRKVLNSVFNLRNEIEARKKLNDQFTTSVYSASYDENRITFYNNQYIDLEKYNETMFDYRNEFSMKRVLISELCKAVEHFNSCGIIQLDWKPANILISFKGVKVIDLEEYVDINSYNGEYPKGNGNFLYRAPECDSSNYGIESNIFSLGLIIFFIVHGRHPYQGLSPNEIKEWKKAGIIDYSPICHPLFKFIINNCIHPDPKKRYIVDINARRKMILPFIDQIDTYHTLTLMYFVPCSCFDEAFDAHEQIYASVLFNLHSDDGPIFTELLYKALNLHPLLEEIIQFKDYYYEDNIFALHFPILPNAAFDEMEKIRLLVPKFSNGFEIYTMSEKWTLSSDEFMDVSGIYSSFRAYQMIFGKGVAIDIEEATFKLINDFEYNHYYAVPYLLIHPFILSYFEDAYELLCLDFRHIPDFFLGYGLTYYLGFVAYNYIDIIAALDFISLIMKQLLEKILKKQIIEYGLGMYTWLYQDNSFYHKYFSPEDYCLDMLYNLSNYGAHANYYKIYLVFSMTYLHFEKKSIADFFENRIFKSQQYA